MSHIKFIVFVVFMMIFSLNLSAQNAIKPKFKNLTLVYFDVEQQGNKKKVLLKSYLEITAGKVHVIEKLYLGISDTTFQLTDSVINKLNVVFNGKRELKSYVGSTKLLPGHHIAHGTESFISYIAENGETDNLIVIDPFMDETFSIVLDQLFRLPYGYNINPAMGKTIKIPDIEKVVLKYHNACTYLPNFEDPPPQMGN